MARVTLTSALLRQHGFEAHTNMHMQLMLTKMAIEHDTVPPYYLCVVDDTDPDSDSILFLVDTAHQLWVMYTPEIPELILKLCKDLERQKIPSFH